MAGKFGLFSKPEDKAIELMLGEKKSANEVVEILKKEGHDFTSRQLRNIKKDAFESLVGEQRMEAMSDFLLDNVKAVTLEFQDMYGKFKELYDKFEKEGKGFDQLVCLREMRTMLNMALKRLGEYKQGIEQIKAQNINIISNSDVMIAIQQNQDKWFEQMEPVMDKGQLVFKKPLPEVVDAYHQWNFRKGKSRVL